jgi:hypothetical protein
MSAIVLVLDHCVDAIVWSPEELVSIVTAISASFRQYLQMINQDTARFLNGFQSRGDVVSQETDRDTTLAMTPRIFWRSGTILGCRASNSSLSWSAASSISGRFGRPVRIALLPTTI